LRLPDALLEHMRAAECVELRLPGEARIRLLRDEYAHFEADSAGLQQQLECLLPLHGRERVETWKRLASEARWEEMVARLLAEHYDPAYQRSISRNFRRAGEAAPVDLGTDSDDEFARAAAALTRT
jgi:tRNA 2-selenouridine synthase